VQLIWIIIHLLIEIFHEEIFFILNSHLENCLKSTQWEIKEQAILALFAISDPDGSTNVIHPHLQNLVPFLLQELKNNNEIVRSTTCWTLSKYSSWIVQQDPLANNILREYLSELMKRVGDTDSNVQSAACIAFAVLVEAAPSTI
jgi:transportin-1